MRKLLVAVAGLAAFASLGGARAQVYPARALTMVVPFAAGGPNDAIARTLAGRMQVSLGQPVMIENVDGSAGSIGTGRLARATPDGYTLGIGYWGTHVANGVLYKLAYDVVSDFEPISLLTESPLLIAANKATPANDLKELVGWLKQNPDTTSWAVPGSGSHIASVFFQKETGTRFKLVPYRGAGPAIADLAAGRIDMAMLNVGLVLPPVRSGAIKAGGAGNSDRRRGRISGPLLVGLVRLLGARPYPEGRHRPAQFGHRGGLGRSRRPCAACRSGAGDFSARATDPGSARRAAEIRDRQMVADHPGRRHQGRMKYPVTSARVRAPASARPGAGWPRSSPR
jgi:tripartite-type tricarboxylate transporter receptor subunit TctC